MARLQRCRPTSTVVRFRYAHTQWSRSIRIFSLNFPFCIFRFLRSFAVFIWNMRRWRNKIECVVAARWSRSTSQYRYSVACVCRRCREPFYRFNSVHERHILFASNETLPWRFGCISHSRVRRAQRGTTDSIYYAICHLRVAAAWKRILHISQLHRFDGWAPTWKFHLTVLVVCQREEIPIWNDDKQISCAILLRKSSAPANGLGFRMLLRFMLYAFGFGCLARDELQHKFRSRLI